MAPAQRFFLHVGMPKTGTTYLQTVLFESRDVLRERGVALVPHRRRGHFALVLATQDRVRPSDGEAVATAAERFARQVARNEQPTALFTHETMGGATPAQVERLLRPLVDHEVHVVLTVRDLARQLASSWQQAVKTRGVIGFSDFVDGVLGGGPPAAGFWSSRDLPALLQRWGTAAPPERTHVVVSPPSGAAPTVLLERFCSVLGLATDGLAAGPTEANPSLGHAQAEVLRRANLALAERLQDTRGDYNRAGRLWLGETVLLQQRGARPLVPALARPRVGELTEQWLEVLRSGGYDVVGGLDELRPRDDAFAGPREPTEPSDAAVLDAAVAALADVMVEREQEHQRAAAAPAPSEVHADPGVPGLGERIRRRLPFGNASGPAGR